MNLLEFLEKVGKEGLDRVWRCVIARAEDVNADTSVEVRLGINAHRVRGDSHGEPTGRRRRRGDGSAVGAVMVNNFHHDDRRRCYEGTSTSLCKR